MDRATRHHAMVDFHQHQERKWCVLEEDHEKALARIADLEFMLRGLHAMLATRFDAYSDHWRARINAALADQRQADPTMAKNANVAATHSEDGQDVNPEYTLFNEIRISEPVSEEGEPCRYIITEQQLQRIRALEADAELSRIVAAKDAEIARLRELHENAHSAAKTLMAERATLMEQAAHWLEVNAPSGGCIETNIADELRALLSQQKEGGV